MWRELSESESSGSELMNEWSVLDELNEYGVSRSVSVNESDNKHNNVNIVESVSVAEHNNQQIVNVNGGVSGVGGVSVVGGMSGVDGVSTSVSAWSRSELARVAYYFESRVRCVLSVCWVCLSGVVNVDGNLITQTTHNTLNTHAELSCWRRD